MERILRLGTQVVYQAGAILRSRYGNRFGLEEKADGTLRSATDLLSSNFLVESIQKYFPEDGITEEEKGLDQRDREHVWIIDPLDSSRQQIFAQGWDYSVIVTKARWIDGDLKAQVAWLYKPHIDEMYRAVAGQGAVMIQNGAEEDLEGRCEEFSIIASQRRLRPETQDIVDRTGAKLVSMNGMAKYMEVFAGRASVGYHPASNPVSLWDVAWMPLFAQETKKIVRRLDGGNISLSQPGVEVEGGFAVADTLCHFKRL